MANKYKNNKYATYEWYVFTYININFFLFFECIDLHRFLFFIFEIFYILGKR